MTSSVPSKFCNPAQDGLKQTQASVPEKNTPQTELDPRVEQLFAKAETCGPMF